MPNRYAHLAMVVQVSAVVGEFGPNRVMGSGSYATTDKCA